jgi:hypothetical protein
VLQVLAAEVRMAKSEGKYSEGVSDLPANSVREEGVPEVLHVNQWTGRKTLHHRMVMDRGMSWQVRKSETSVEPPHGSVWSGVST